MVISVITDYEIWQINAIHTVFREITHQGGRAAIFIIVR